MAMIQCQVLNRILTSGEKSIITDNNLSEDFFSDYVEEFRFIKEHIRQFDCVPDPTTFASKFKDFSFFNIHESDKFLIGELYKDKNMREMVKVFQEVRDLVNTGRADEALDLYKRSVTLTSELNRVDAVDLLTDTSRYDSYMERCLNFDKYYLKTGFDELDEVIGGWDRTEDLVTIVGRPGQGKSYIMLKSVVAAVKQGLRVGLYSGEMSCEKVGYRVDTLLSNISNTAISKGNIQYEKQYRDFITSLNGTYKGCLKVLTPKMLGDYATVTDLSGFVDKEKLDILFVDQYSLLKDENKARTPSEQTANISKSMKNLQVLKKIPIIAASQQNRTAVEDDGVSVSNIAMSDRIGQDSTIVLFLEHKDNNLKIHLVKSRESSSGKTLEYLVDFDKGTFSYDPTTSDALGGKAAEDLKREFDGDGIEVFHETNN